MGQQALTDSLNDDGGAGSLLSLAAFKIRQFRKKNRLTGTALAERLGVSQPAVYFWETGRKIPRTEMQGRLHQHGICSPNDWHEPAPVANDDGPESAD